jgi:2,5-dihydroxypyridine 5,6-dioxygenase
MNPNLIDAFTSVLQRCALVAGDRCTVLSQTDSRRELVDAAMLASRRLGATTAVITVANPPTHAPVPVRSTGASDVLAHQDAVVAALAASTLVIDCTVEGLQHAAELPRILSGGARVLVVSNEHPEILIRCVPTESDEAQARQAMKRLKAASTLQVTSRAGTDLHVKLQGARVGGVWGYTSKPGTLTHWPGGLVVAFPAAKSVQGTLVLDVGDVNLTFKQYLRDRVVLRIVDDHVVDIEGESLDAQTLRGYFAAWGDREAYAVSHVGWGLNPRARWDAMNFYDKADFNGTELRAFAGNFLYSTGANEVAGRHTLGHFDLPLRGCTIRVDDQVVVNEGQLVGDLS